MPIEEQVVAIFSGVRGYLDRIPVGDVQRFQTELLRSIRAKNADIMASIRSEKQITPDNENKLKAAIEEFAKGFA